VEVAEKNIRNLDNPSPVIQLSAQKTIGMEEYNFWLKKQLEHYKVHDENGKSVLTLIHKDTVPANHHGMMK